MSDSDWEEVDPNEWEDITPVAPTKQPKQPRARGLFEKVYDASGSMLQGLTLGGGDELTAAIGSLFGMGYDDTLKADRAAQKRYEAEHPYESAAFEIAGGLPTAFALPGAGVTSLKGLAGLGALYGGATGFGKGEDGLANRLGGAALGGTVGGVTAGGIKLGSEAVKPLARALSSVRLPSMANEAGAILPQGTSEPLSKAEAAIMRRMRNVPNEQIDAMRQEMAQALTEGSPLFLQESGGDVGIPGLINYARHVANREGGEGIAQPLIRQRAEDAGERITGILDDLSPKRDVYQGGQSLMSAVKGKEEALKQARDIASSPLYQDAFDSFPEVPKADLNRLATYNKPLRSALEEARSMGEAAYLPENSTLGLHKAKMAIDDMIATAKNNQNNYKASELLDLQKEVLKLLDRSTQGKYKAGRELYSELSDPINYLQDGPVGRFLAPNTNPANVGQAVAEMDPTAMRIAVGQLGNASPMRDAMRAGMQKRLDNVGETRNLAEALIGRAAPKQRLSTLMGDDAAGELLRKLGREDKIKTIGNAYHRGSSTASNLAEAADFERSARFLDGIINITKKPIATGAELLKNGLFGPDEELARALAGILFDSQSGAQTLERIAPYAIQRNNVAGNVDEMARALATYVARPGVATGLGKLQDK